MHWREKALLDVLQDRELTTSEIVSRVNMSKATALKYLKILENKNRVDSEDIGPTKVWSLKNGIIKSESKKIKILVVDDDRNILTIIHDSLESEHIEIYEALNGKEALGMVFAKSPDILILDIMMPDMDGYEVCEELKKKDQTKDIPIIILTAKSGIDDKLKAMDLGINDYIVKPFDPRELKARINMALRPSS